MAIARGVGFECYALSFDYGQRHRVELELAAKQVELQGAVRHNVIKIDLRSVGGSALTSDIEVPKDRAEAEMGNGVPVTYVPARNTIFLSFALAWAEVLGCSDIFLGVNELDYSGYPDCRPAFIQAFEKLANLATKAGIEGVDNYDIHVPLIELTKCEIIRRGLDLGVDYAFTSSCYDPGPDGRPCGRCDACLLRAKGFAEAGVPDPLLARFGL
jgi:7-cyano-7-deazaguanine synthase